MFIRIINNLRRPFPDLVLYIFEKLQSLIWRFYILHVGDGFHVCQGAKIQGGKFIRIGDGFYAGKMLWIQAISNYAGQNFIPRIDIGDYFKCSQSVHISSNSHISIGDYVLIGSGVHITDHAHGRYRGELQDSPLVPPYLRQLAPGQPVNIEKNVWLCDGVVVLPGVTIGAGSIVGANSVVSNDIPPGVIAVGCPAVPIKRFDNLSGIWISIKQYS